MKNIIHKISKKILPLIACIFSIILLNTNVFAYDCDFIVERDEEDPESLYFIMLEHPAAETTTEYDALVAKKSKKLDEKKYLPNGCRCHKNSEDQWRKGDQWPPYGPKNDGSGEWYTSTYRGYSYIVTNKPLSKYSDEKEEDKQYWDNVLDGKFTYLKYNSKTSFTESNDGNVYGLNKLKVFSITKPPKSISLPDACSPTWVSNDNAEKMKIDLKKTNYDEDTKKLPTPTKYLHYYDTDKVKFMFIPACYPHNGEGMAKYKVVHIGNATSTNRGFISKNYLKASTLKNIEEQFGKSMGTLGNSKTVYISDFKIISTTRNSKGDGNYGDKRVLYTAGQLFNYMAPDTPNGKYYYSKNNFARAGSAVVNTYDNKLVFPEEVKKKYTVRYIDVSGKDNNVILTDIDKGDSNVKVKKSDNSKFTTDEYKKMLKSSTTKEILASDKGDFTVSVPSDSEYLGYNMTTKTATPIAGEKIITIAHKDTKVTGSDKEEDLYIDVYFQSKKRVYVRHKNVTAYYNASQNKLTGLSADKVNNAPSLPKGTVKAELYDKATGKLENANFGGSKITGYEEYYVVNVKKYLRLVNLNESGNIDGKEQLEFKEVTTPVTTRKFLSYEWGINGIAKNAIDELNGKYNVGTLSLRDIDKDMMSAKDYKTTYYDMLYATTTVNPRTPKTFGNKTYNATGALYFQSELPDFIETKTNNSPYTGTRTLATNKIPSGENIKAGILEVYPYMFTRADIQPKLYYALVSNGKNVVPIFATYDQIQNATIFAIDKAELTDKNSQPGGKLFSGADTVTLNVKDSYKQTSTTGGYIPGKLELKVETQKITSCSTCHGTVCNNKVARVTIKGDMITLNGGNLLEEKSYTSSNYIVRTEKCKKDGNKVVIDPSKTETFDLNIPELKIANFEDMVKSKLFSSSKPGLIKYNQMDDLYQNNELTIPGDKFNGKRIVAGKLDYKGYVIRGALKDTVNPVLCGQSEADEGINVEPIIVHTPVVAKMKLTSESDMVNHTDFSGPIDADIIQKNAKFKLQLINDGVRGLHPTYTQINDFTKYTKEHYVKFLFDLQYVKVFDAAGNEVPELSQTTIVPAETWIKVPVGGSLESQAVYVPDDTEKEILTSLISKYTVKTLATNAPSTPEYINALLTQDGNAIGGFADEKANKTLTSENVHLQFHPGIALKDEVKYAAMATRETKNIGRIYDFKVSDIVDIDWKYVFRKTDGIEHSGRVFYAGSKKWNVYSDKVNELVTRPDTEVGTNPKRVLPVGPYKHTNLGYTNAPKLGYSFSFDMKTTGGIDLTSLGEGEDKVTKQVNVKPQYYFVGKDGTRYTKDIDLYYKVSSGRYVKLGSTADNGQIAMRPEDGARYISQYESVFSERYLSKDMISIGKYSTQLTLKANTNMATNNKKFVQLWYGSFKLPNSTKAVPKGEKNLDKALTDGYIGVKFNITCTEKLGGEIVTISYGNNDKSQPGVPNTTQWDYESFLGATPGTSFSGSLKLEKGTWNISDSVYQDIKGTVILYDADAKAADDFDTGSVK